MSKHQISTYDQGKIVNKTNESELVKGIMESEFFVWMNDNGYDYNSMKELFEARKISATEQSEFNDTLRRAKEEINVNIMDMIICFEENFVKFKKILDIIDSDTKYELKKELSKKHYIKLEETNLNQILEI